MHVRILALGKINQEIVNTVKQTVEERLKIKIQPPSRHMLPEQFYNGARKQYSASQILDHLAKRYLFSSDRIIALMEEDLYVLPLEYIFATTDASRHIALISTARLKKTSRIINATLHEIGHLYGLDHCETKDCIMFPTQGDVRVIDKKTHFCQLHRM